MTRPIAPASACRRVLVVDDEPHLRGILVEAITDMLFHPTGVGTAEAATRALQKETFDIIILDLNLPGASGMDLLRSLQSQSPRPQVVIHTGFGNLEEARLALRLDVVDFLTKPCGLSELETALERARNRRLIDIGQTLAPHMIAEEPHSARRHRTTTPDAIETVAHGSASSSTVATNRPAHPAESNPTALEDVERDHILAVLARNGGNRAATAAQLGISVRKLYYRLDQYHREGHLRDG